MIFAAGIAVGSVVLHEGLHPELPVPEGPTIVRPVAITTATMTTFNVPGVTI
ncbi:MAG: hypothetical protein ACLPV2_05340 [Steroidobacteraceae bacterium]